MTQTVAAPIRHWEQCLVTVSRLFRSGSRPTISKSISEVIGNTDLYSLIHDLDEDLKSGHIVESELKEIICTGFPFLKIGSEYNHNQKRQMTAFYKLAKDLKLYKKEFGDHSPARTYTGHGNLGKRFNNFKYAHPTGTARSTLLLRVLKVKSMPASRPWHETHTGIYQRGKYKTNWEESFNQLKQVSETMGTTAFYGAIPKGNDQESKALRWAYRQKTRYLADKMPEEQIERLKTINFFRDHKLDLKIVEAA